MNGIAENIGVISGAVAGITVVLGAVFAAARWFERQSKQDVDIQNIKKENMMIVSALSACLDGLEQLGANHSVTAEKEKLDRYILEQAHRS